jgi:iron complex transport system ATP-binding protein
MSEKVPAVRCVGVEFGYGAGTLLRSVDLELVTGEVTAILGRNGAGKSTLLRLIAGLLQPAKGEIHLLERKLSAWSRREVAQHVALVTQEGAAENAFTAMELVLLGRAPHQSRFAFDTRADRERAEQSLREVGLMELAQRPVWSLSGGERRRVRLARALAQEPRVLLLDEPTAFLDMGHQLQILELARQRARDGVAVVAVLHDPNLAASYADRVVLIDGEGRASSGAAAEMLQSGFLSRLYDLDLAEARSDRVSHALFFPASTASPGPSSR